MNGYWGAIGLVVVGVVGIMAAGGPDQRFKSESEYVTFCTNELAKAGLPSHKSRSGCKCMYRQGRATLEARGEFELRESEAEAFYDQCMAPVVSAYEAEAVWNAQGSDSSLAGDNGWGEESGGSSDWGS
ncbi:hypothetical protein EH31_03570 [Erythrobacter longus]|uniref:Uncharacterized protein n=1 Tax=Erythrobacter longus TaxID=1044 RepID=A0A074N1G8_ERYLO|nr:hypothetical protein [Erythrobacter longus]KEO91762.1 hypothetical protein EH31_03570 [Erythrobacter longus]